MLFVLFYFGFLVAFASCDYQQLEWKKWLSLSNYICNSQRPDFKETKNHYNFDHFTVCWHKTLQLHYKNTFCRGKIICKLFKSSGRCDYHHWITFVIHSFLKETKIIQFQQRDKINALSTISKSVKIDISLLYPFNGVVFKSGAK